MGFYRRDEDTSEQTNDRFDEISVFQFRMNIKRDLVGRRELGRGLPHGSRRGHRDRAGEEPRTGRKELMEPRLHVQPAAVLRLMVPLAGLEPARVLAHLILSQVL